MLFQNKRGLRLFLLTVVGLTLSANGVIGQAGESWAELQYIYSEDTPLIAREKYTFSRGLISCRTRQEQIDRNERCWGLAPPEPVGNIEVFEPDKAKLLAKIAGQIGPEGPFRPQTEKILGSGGFTGADLDAAIVDRIVVWNTGMDWANVLQVRIGDTHIFYVAFYKEHKGAKDVPVDAALVPLPGVMMPEPRGRDVVPSDSFSRAEKYLAAGEYAKCAQQALLDAGFDPRGVDGAPGAGARAALEAWGQANGLPVPPFTKGFSAQICHVLTASPAYPQAPRQIVETNVWPVWSGNVFYNDNLADFSLAIEGENILQVSAMNFRGGLRFGDEQNRDMDLPWRPAGIVLLDGADGRDGKGGGSEPTSMARDILRVLDRLTPDDGLRSLQQMLATNQGSIENIRAALSESGNGDPQREVAWTTVDRVGGHDIIVADILFDTSRRDRRALFFMEYDDHGDADRLLYAAVPATQQQPAGQNGFPQISQQSQNSGLVDADCDQLTAPARSSSVARHDGFDAFPVRFCWDDTPVLDLIAWMKTDAAGTSLTATFTHLDGRGISVQGSSFDEATQSNLYEIAIGVNDTPVTCRVEKPSGGIAVLGESFCR